MKRGRAVGMRLLGALAVLAACVPSLPSSESSVGRATQDEAAPVFADGAVWVLAVQGWPALPANGGEREAPDAVLRASGSLGDSVHAGLTIAATPAPGAGRPSVRLRLPSDQRLGGMRTLRLDPLDADPTRMSAFAASRLHRALGVPAPRVAHAVLTVDGEPWGLYALVEHVGDVFVEREIAEGAVPLTIDADGALVAEGGDAGELEALWADRLGPEVADAGARALASLVDVDALVLYLGAAGAAGDSEAHAPTAGSLLLADRGDDEAHALVALPGRYGRSFDDAGADPALGAPGPGPAARRLSDLALAIPAVRERFDRALESALACLEEPACLAEPVSLQAAALAGLPEAAPFAPTADLLPAFAARAAALRAFLDRERALDAPDGDDRYLSFVRRGEGSFEVRFRHRTPGRHAAAVEFVRFGANGAEQASLELTYDSERDLWRRTLSLPATPIRYGFAVTDADGEVRVERDGTNRVQRSGRSYLDPRRVGTLEHLWTTSIDVSEPSGLCFVGDWLATVSDRKDELYLLDPEDGRLVEERDIEASGLEGIAWDPLTDLVLVAEEGRGRVAWLDASGVRVARVKIDGAEDDNSGLEGLALRPSDGHLFAAKEKDPARLWELDADGTVLSRVTFTGAADVSALDWSSSDGVLYALTDEDQSILRLAPDGTVEASWPIDVPQPEGIAVRDGQVWVVSDSERTLDAFALDAWRFE